MHRIKDYYNWKTLEHWQTVLNSDDIRIRVQDDEKIEDSLLISIVKILKCDCFPIAIICCCNGKGQKEIYLTPMWVGIFDFLNGKRSLKIEKEEIFFEKLDIEDQRSILKAQIASIWIASD